MTRTDSKLRRVFVEGDLSVGQALALDRSQSNHLLTVLRLKAGDCILIFNGRHGEFRARIEPQGRKSAIVVPENRTRPQTARPDLQLLFAPIKQTRMEYLIQKAVELGVGVLKPVATQHTQNTRLKAHKLQSYAIEAAEQCGTLTLPEIRDIGPLTEVLGQEHQDRHLVFCDESAPLANPLAALQSSKGARISILIGPEGGFSNGERARLASHKNVTRIALGPRVLRADTAAVAVLALVQAVTGDWAG